MRNITPSSQCGRRERQVSFVNDGGVESSPIRRRAPAPSGVSNSNFFFRVRPDVDDRLRSNTRLSPPKSRSARPRPRPPPHLLPLPILPPNPPLQKPLPPKTTGNHPTLPKSRNGAPNPPLPVKKPNSPAPNGKPSAPANKPNVKPSVSPLKLGTVSVITSPPRSPLPTRSCPTPSRRRWHPSVRSNTSNRTGDQGKGRNARCMEKQRLAHLLSGGNTSRHPQRRRILPCPFRKPLYPIHPLTNTPFSRHLPHPRQPRHIPIPGQTQTRPTFFLPRSPPSWTTGSHHGHDYPSYYPRLPLTYYFRSLTASCLVSEKFLQKMSSLDGLVGKHDVEAPLLALGFDDKGILC